MAAKEPRRDGWPAGRVVDPYLAVLLDEQQLAALSSFWAGAERIFRPGLAGCLMPQPGEEQSKRWLPTVAAAASLGMLAITRPLTALAVAFPFGLHGLYLVNPRRPNHPAAPGGSGTHCAGNCQPAFCLAVCRHRRSAAQPLHAVVAL